MYFYNLRERRTLLMPLKNNIFSLVVICGLSYCLTASPCNYDKQAVQSQGEVQPAPASRLADLASDLGQAVESGSSAGMSAETINEMERIISEGKVTDPVVLSDACYFLGHYFLLDNSYDQAGRYFSEAARNRERAGISDRRYALSISNMAVVQYRKGDLQGAYETGLRALEARRMISGADSSALSVNYLNLASICLEMAKSEKAVVLAEAGLRLARQYPDMIDQKITADLYQVIGLSLYRNSELAKSLVYCREALRLYELNEARNSKSRLLILNTISQIYLRLGQPADAEDFFRKALATPGDENIEEKYLIYINYADFLAECGRAAEGEKVLEEGLSKVKKAFGSDSREYCMMLASRADFIEQTSGDIARAIELYENCLPYINKHPWDILMKDFILTNYADGLYKAKSYGRALEVISHLIATSERHSGLADADNSSGSYSGTDIEILKIKYKSLKALSQSTGDIEYLRQAVATGRVIVSLYDRQRLEMTEEESRTSLSIFSRELYTGLTEDYVQLYDREHKRSYLDGVFEFIERSKVAGFLASMRELNAAKFALPEDLVSLDNGIKKEIGLFRELIANETSKPEPDSQRVATWESRTFRLLRSRDSLMAVFETKYPSFYNLKYRSSVISLDNVSKVISRKVNLLSYIMTDDRLYIFVTNRRHTEIITRDIDSTFHSSVVRFEKMLSGVPATSGVRQSFNGFMDLAYELYSMLLEPAVPYLKGDKIVISPDNILSYLPFETLVTEQYRSPELLYREAPFALKKYRFSYIYSVTLSSETARHTRSLRNDLVAFAPTYDDMEIDDSLSALFPGLRGPVRPLPYAVSEAEDAVSQCGGTAFIAGKATEGEYKRSARNFDIIHLAMHTVVNDNHPAFSKMIFSLPDDGGEDGFLNTYEVYNVPINAMMVVLSSCNTGAGMLVNGEGILSLARGFLSAGSRAVVMSMWAVEDYSASAVIKLFYRNMRSGQTKSAALRNARLKFLRTADQARSHPYYWAALVIYGDDTPLWFDSVKLYTGLLLLLLVSAILIAVIYRGPRS